MIIDKIGKEYYSKKESDISNFDWNKSGLKLIISTWTDSENQIGIEYNFDSVNGLRFLDEGDFLGYWDQPEFNNNYHLHRIIQGGWKSGEIEKRGILEVSRAIDDLKEFFISTSNSCMTILAYEKPKIKEIDLKA